MRTVSRTQLICRTGSVWPFVWQGAEARVLWCHVAAHEPKQCGPNGFGPVNSSSYIGGRRFLVPFTASLPSPFANLLRASPRVLPRRRPSPRSPPPAKFCEDCSALLKPPASPTPCFVILALHCGVLPSQVLRCFLPPPLPSPTNFRLNAPRDLCRVRKVSIARSRSLLI
jgi:hypothetical protein